MVGYRWIHGLVALAVVFFVIGDVFIRHDAGQRLWADGGWAAASLAAAVACLLTARALHGPRRRAWLAYGLGCIAWFAGILVWTWLELVDGEVTPFPAIADAGFLALAPLFVVGLIYHGVTAPGVVLTIRNLADLGVIAAAVLAAVIIVLNEPLRSAGLPLSYRLVALSYPSLYVTAFLFAALVLLRHAVMDYDRRVTILIVVALGVHALTNSLYAYSLLEGSFQPGHYLDGFWVLAFAIIVSAALEQRRRASAADAAARFAPLDQRVRRADALGFAGALIATGLLAIAYREQADPVLWNRTAVLFTLLAAFLGLREWTSANLQGRLFGEVQSSERELNRILESLQETYFRTDLNGAVQRVSASAAAVLGHGPAALAGRRLQELWPDAAGADPLGRALEEGGGRVQHFEARVRRADGSSGWVSINAHYLYDNNRAPVAIEGTARDVTAQRRAEEQMYKLSSALEQTADTVMITDREGIIEYVNPAFETTTGFRRDESVGCKPTLIRSGRHERRFYERLWRTIQSGEPFNDVFVNQRKDRSLYYEAKTITPMKDASGTVTHFIATGKDITEQMQTQERLRFLAEHDVLTELPNRQVLVERVRHALARARRHGRACALLFMDLDQFKYVNDSLGHPAGDRLLVQIAKRLLDHVREADTVARFGGDEFVVLVDDAENSANVAAVAEKLLGALAPPFDLDGLDLHVTASIGISMFPNDGAECETLLRNADSAMYRAKEAGRGTYRFYSGDMSERALERLTLESRLRNALDLGQFTLHYQPQVDVRRRRIVAVEALLRWNHPDLGLVSPLNFVPILEDTGWIVPVGEWVLREACAQLARWTALGCAPQLHLAVNISARQVIERSFCPTVERILAETGIAPERLELEVTESIFLRESKVTVSTLRALDELGVRLAMDDFGTGYSSLGYLRRFPIRTVKVDRSFIRDIITDADDEALTAAVIAMAERLDLRVVAEGVETEAQLDLLQGLGCSLVQGYLTGRPVPAQELAERLLESAGDGVPATRGSR